MSEISRDEVAYIAELSRLLLSPEEEEQMTRDLGKILGFVKKLQEVDTTGIQPTAHASPVATPLRADEVADVMDSGLALSNAPARKGTAFCVPKVIGQEDEG